MHSKKPPRPRRTTPKRKPGDVTFADIKATLLELDRRGVLEWPGRTGVRRVKHSNIEIFTLLLRAFFTGRALQKWIPRKERKKRQSEKMRVMNSSIFYKLKLWRTGKTRALPKLWEAYLRNIPQLQLEAWCARLLGSGGPVRRPGAPRYVNRAPPPALMQTLLVVSGDRVVELVPPRSPPMIPAIPSG